MSSGSTVQGIATVADDLQLKQHFKVTASALCTGIEKLESCLSDVRHWMPLNVLKRNDSKTEFRPIVPSRYWSLIDGLSITIDKDTNIPVEHVSHPGSTLRSSAFRMLPLG